MVIRFFVWWIVLRVLWCLGKHFRIRGVGLGAITIRTIVSVWAEGFLVTTGVVGMFERRTVIGRSYIG